MTSSLDIPLAELSRRPYPNQHIRIGRSESHTPAGATRASVTESQRVEGLWPNDEHVYSDAGEIEQASLPRADGGKDAWLFLAGCFTIEALVWGKSGLFCSLRHLKLLLVVHVLQTAGKMEPCSKPTRSVICDGTYYSGSISQEYHLCVDRPIVIE